MIRFATILCLCFVLDACAVQATQQFTAPTSAASLNNHLDDGTDAINCNKPANHHVRYDGIQQVHITNVSNCANDFVFAVLDIATGEVYGWDHERIPGYDSLGNAVGRVISWTNRRGIPAGSKCQIDGWFNRTTPGDPREVQYWGGKEFDCGDPPNQPTCEDLGTCKPTCIPTPWTEWSPFEVSRKRPAVCIPTTWFRTRVDGCGGRTYEDELRGCQG